MKAAWYEKQGPARDVLVVGEMPDPIPAAGEVRIRIAASGINPGDIKKRENAGRLIQRGRRKPHRDDYGFLSGQSRLSSSLCTRMKVPTPTKPARAASGHGYGGGRLSVGHAAWLCEW
jgi:hypothetical protein